MTRDIDSTWRGGRVDEGGGFEIRCAVTPYRGFESPPLRHSSRLAHSSLASQMLKYRVGLVDMIQER